MTDSRLLDLCYGHLGQPQYDKETKEWHFVRQLGCARQIRSLGSIIHAIPPARTLTSSSLGAVHRAKATKHLLKAYPELTPSFYVEENSNNKEDIVPKLVQAIIPDLAQSSEAIVDVTQSYDPIKSDLCAFGNIVNATNAKKSRVLKKLLAVASGQTGELVRLVILATEQLRRGKDKGLNLTTVTAKDCEEGWWAGCGPIQQLVFGQSEGQASSLLAVRQQGGISILQPTLQGDFVSPRNVQGLITFLPSSRVDANHLVDLRTKDMMGVPAADVSFNPWDHLQLATVNQAGFWSIWSVEARVRSKGIWKLLKDFGGYIGDGDAPGSDLTQPILDGWGKIVWIRGPDIILVVNRKCIRLINIKLGARSLAVPDIAVANSTDWILDVERSPVHLDHFFVVTSSRLLWLKVSSPDGSQDEAASVLLSWIHFRNPQDPSLSLHTVGISDQAIDSDDVVKVLIYAQTNDLITIYTFNYCNKNGRASSLYDPYPLTLHTLLSSTSGTIPARDGSCLLPNVSCIIMTPIALLEGSSTVGQHGTEKRLFQLTALLSDLSLIEQLHVQSRADIAVDVEPFTRHRRGPPKSSGLIADDFIVPDGMHDEVDEAFAPRPRGNPRFDSNRPLVAGDEDPRQLEMGWLAEAIWKGDPEASAVWVRELPKPVKIDKCFETVNAAVDEKLIQSNYDVETIFDLAGATELSISDVDEATQSFTHLLETITQPSVNPDESSNTMPRTASFVAPSMTPQLYRELHLELGAEIKYTGIYESMIRSFIRPLSETTPSRTRIALDRDLRGIAAQLYLAAHVVRVRSDISDVEQDDIEAVFAPDSLLSLPVRGKPSDSSLSRKYKLPLVGASSPPRPSQSSQDAESQALLPTPDPTTPSDRSSDTAQSRRTSTASSNVSAQDAEDPSSRRLRTLTSLNPQPTLPSKISNMLSHWTVGADPASYDWYAAQKAAETPANEAETPSQTKRRLKAERRARKRAKLNSSGTEGAPASSQTQTQSQASNFFMHDPGSPSLSRRQSLPSSQIQPYMLSNSIGTSSAVHGSSQVIPQSSQLGGSNSQVGTRGGGKQEQEGQKKKKKRKAGF